MEIGRLLSPILARNQLGVHCFFVQVVECDGVVEVVCADARSIELREVCAAAECFTDVTCERADVGAATAGDGEGKGGPGVVGDREFGDDDLLGGRGDVVGFSGACQFVEFFAADFFRAEDGGGLGVATAEGGERIFDVAAGGMSGDDVFRDVAFGIVGGAGGAEACGGFVGLFEADEVGEFFGAFIDAENQESGGERVEGARMTHPAGACYTPDPVYSVMAGDARGLIEEEEAVHAGSIAGCPESLTIQPFSYRIAPHERF